MFEHPRSVMDEGLRAYLLRQLSDKRRRHTEGVLETAMRLADQAIADRTEAERAALRDKIELAAWSHDMFRGRSAEELDLLIDAYGVDPKYKKNANLSHGKLAAAAMEKDWGIKDREVLDAVAYHTTGRARMTLLDEIIYLADAIEPGRDYPGVEKLRRMVNRLEKGVLEEACLASLESTAAHLKAQDIPVDEDTSAAIAWLQSVVKMPRK